KQQVDSWQPAPSVFKANDNNSQFERGRSVRPDGLFSVYGEGSEPLGATTCISTRPREIAYRVSPAMSWIASLSMSLCLCLSTVLTLMPSSAAVCLLLSPLAT